MIEKYFENSYLRRDTLYIDEKPFLLQLHNYLLYAVRKEFDKIAVVFENKYVMYEFIDTVNKFNSFSVISWYGIYIYEKNADSFIELLYKDKIDRYDHYRCVIYVNVDVNMPLESEVSYYIKYKIEDLASYIPLTNRRDNEIYVNEDISKYLYEYISDRMDSDVDIILVFKNYEDRRKFVIKLFDGYDYSGEYTEKDHININYMLGGILHLAINGYHNRHTQYETAIYLYCNDNNDIKAYNKFYILKNNIEREMFKRWMITV